MTEEITHKQIFEKKIELDMDILELDCVYEDFNPIKDINVETSNNVLNYPSLIIYNV